MARLRENMTGGKGRAARLRENVAGGNGRAARLRENMAGGKGNAARLRENVAGGNGKAARLRKTFPAGLLVLALVLWAGWQMRIRSLYYAMGVSEAVLLAAVLHKMPLLKLSLEELTAGMTALLFNEVLLQALHLGGPAFVQIVPFIFLLLPELLLLVRWMQGRKRGYGILAGYAVLCCWGVLCVYRRWERFALELYLAGEGACGSAVKILYLLACVLIIALLVFLTAGLQRVFLDRRILRLQEYSETYTEIDRSILLVLFLTLGTLSMRELARLLARFLPENNEIHLLFFPVAENSYDIPLLWMGSAVLMILIQIIYIRLLVKSISAKEEMRSQERDLRQLAEYNRALEKNMEEIRGIRHDIKNMFLTMGGYVDRSGDAEMKAFYAENLVPFARQTLQKNDLYGKLARIHSESLKSFLYYKIMQGIEQNVPVELALEPVSAEEYFDIGQIDLIRILGILIDNALEEAKICGGSAAVTLRETEREYLFLVSNTVRSQVRERGITAGTTDKEPGAGGGLDSGGGLGADSGLDSGGGLGADNSLGRGSSLGCGSGLGRGHGLLIAESLVGKYKNVLLNSFFRGEEFVQCLRIAKGKEGQAKGKEGQKQKEGQF